MGAVRSLNGDDETLIVRDSVLRVPRTAVVPNGQVLQILVRHVRIVSVLWVRKNLLLLLFEICDQIVQLVFHLAQLFFVLENFKISVSKLRIDILQWVSSGVTATQGTRFLREAFLFIHLLLSLFLVASASLNRARSIPPNIVLTYFANETNALQYVRDVIDSSLLHLQILHCLVQV